MPDTVTLRVLTAEIDETEKAADDCYEHKSANRYPESGRYVCEEPRKRQAIILAESPGQSRNGSTDP